MKFTSRELNVVLYFKKNITVKERNLSARNHKKQRNFEYLSPTEVPY